VFDKADHTFICKMEVALQLTEYYSLRGMKGEDDKRSQWYFSVYDFINFVSDRDECGEAYARETLERLAKEEPWYASDIAGGCRNLKFHGSGEKETPCMTVNGLRWLLDMLDEMNLVKVVRFEIVKDVFIRYLRGDMSLIKEVRENAVSAAPKLPTTTPVNVMAAMANPKKRKQLAELELDERDLKVRRMCVELVHDFVKAMSTLDEDWQEDDRLVQKTKDWCQNRVLE
jgi:hypothetical protein